MTPRIAGIVGMAASLAVAIGAGILISHSPTAILGALVLVVATVAFSVSTTWLYRKSWAKDSWPAADLSVERARRRFHRLVVVQSALTPILVGFAVWMAFQGEFFPLVLAVLGILNLSSVLRTHRLSRRAEAAEGQEPVQRG
jgi:hypothetical protein